MLHNGKSGLTIFFLCSPTPIKLLFLGRFIFTWWHFIPLSLSLLSLYQIGRSALLLFFYCPDQTWGPTFHLILLFLSDHHSIHLSFIVPIQVSGGGSKVTGRAPLSAFLMSLKHRGSAYYGDEEIQAGQKVTDLTNKGPLHSSTPSLLPFFSPLLVLLPLFYESSRLSCKV